MGSLTENPATQGKGGYRVGDEPTAQANPVRANYGAVQPYIQNCHGLLRRLIHLGEKVRGKSEVVEPSTGLPHPPSIQFNTKCGCPDCMRQAIPKSRNAWKARRNKNNRSFGAHAKPTKTRRHRSLII